MHRPVFNVTILHRLDVDKLADYPKNIRDQIIIDLSRLQGFRTGEITTLSWHHIDVDQRFISVLDSKKNILVSLPMHWRLRQLFIEYAEGRLLDGFVIRPLPTVNIKKSALGKAVTNEAIQNTIKHYAREAGIHDWQRYTPTLLRAFFAADWFRKKRSLKILQTMMRHNTLATTLRYVNRIVFWSDLRAEYERIQRIPTDRRLKKSSTILENRTTSECMVCPAKCVCRYVDEAVESEWATGCKFFELTFRELASLVKGAHSH